MKSKYLRQLHNNLWTLLLHQLLLEEVPSSHLHLTCFGPEVMTVPMSPCGWDLFSALTIVSFLSSLSMPFLNDTQLNATLGHLMNCCTKWKHLPSSNVMLSSAAKSVFVHENVPFKIIIHIKRLRVSLPDLNGLRSSLHPFVGMKCGQKLRQRLPLLSEPWLWSEFTTSLLNFILKRMTWTMCLGLNWTERSWAFLTEEKMERGNWNGKDGEGRVSWRITYVCRGLGACFLQVLKTNYFSYSIYYLRTVYLGLLFKCIY